MIVMAIAGAGMLFLMLMVFGWSGVFSPHPVLPELQRNRSRIQFSPLPGGKMPSPQVQERLNRELSDHFVQQRLQDIIERKLNPPPPTAPASTSPPEAPRDPSFDLPNKP